MFQNFKAHLFSDPNFKEDSVREVVIAPILTRLGYFPTGSQTAVRSKNLIQPFIYVGTRKHPVNIIPDYTLYFEDRPVLVLDAKSPTESVNSSANVQQAYSYAIHPEIQTNHFALCNGKRLAVYSIQAKEPLLDIAFEEFESRWNDIEKHLAPKYLLEPELRELMPDLGFKLYRLAPDTEITHTIFCVRIDGISMISKGFYTASTNTEFAGQDHCISFDFTEDHLTRILAGLPTNLTQLFLGALERAPFQGWADFAVEVDLRAHLGEPTQGMYEMFVPLIVDEVIGSRFNPTFALLDREDVPPHIFRLSKALKLI
jgi:hypothetical protein